MRMKWVKNNVFWSNKVNDYTLMKVIKMPIKNISWLIQVVQQFRSKDNLYDLVCSIKFSHHVEMRFIMTHELQVLYLVSDNSLNVTCTGDPFSTKTTTSFLLSTVTSAETTQTTGIVIHYYFVSPMLKLYIKYTTFSLFTTKSLIVVKLFYWPINISSIYYPLSNCWALALFSLVNKSRDNDVTTSKRRSDFQNWRTRILKHLMDIWVNNKLFKRNESVYHFFLIF